MVGLSWVDLSVGRFVWGGIVCGGFAWNRFVWGGFVSVPKLVLPLDFTTAAARGIDRIFLEVAQLIEFKKYLFFLLIN